MTIKLKGRKASLYATAMAISLVALSGTAHAQSASNGKFKTSALPTKEAASTIAKPVATVTADVKAATDAANAVKKKVTDTLLLARSTATANAYNDYAAPAVAGVTAVAAVAASAATIVNGTFVPAVAAVAAVTGVTASAGGALAVLKTKQAELATATSALAKAEANKLASDTLISKLTADKTAADAAVTTAGTNLALANAIVLPASPTTAETAAKNAAIATATAAQALAVERQTVVGAALNAANTAANAANTGIVALYTAAIATKASKEGEVAVAQGEVISKKAALDAALLVDTGFANNLAAVNAAAGTSFTASYEGIAAIEAYDDVSTAVATYASNGYTRTTTSLAAAAASSNANIAMAAGALTDSTAALDAGANFETEVLSVLVNHETRITKNTTDIAANTTAIAALDVRTTANTTAIAALDVRTTANTTAIANEVTARIAADNALGARITTETNERIAADNVLRDQIASSTATAIAMGGAALLPDMGFTLSGNVAVYEGAQAMALNAAAKVGANAFVTASVGGGLNKNGSVGGRVGFVFGF